MVKQMKTLIVMFAFTLAFLAFSSAQAATEAGTVIGNAATAIYFDDENNTYTTTSNIVQTTVTAVCGADVQNAAGVTKTGVPGQIVYLPYSVENTGNSENTFSLTASGASYSNVIYEDTNGNGIPDPGENIVTSVTLNINETVSLVVAATIPVTAINNDSDGFTFTATGTAVVGCASSAAGTVNVTTDATIATNKSVNLTTAAPTDILTYTVTLQNVGLANAKAGATYLVDTTGNGTGDTNVDGILVIDQVPAGSTYIAASLAGSPATNPTGYPVYSFDGNTWHNSEAGATAAGGIVYVGYLMEDATPANGTLEDVLSVDQQATMTFNVTVDDPFAETDNSVDNFAEVAYSDSSQTLTSTTNTTSTYIPPSSSSDISAGGLDGYTWTGATWSTGNTTPTAEEDTTVEYTNDNYGVNAPAGSWITFLHQGKNNSGATDVINLTVLTGETSLPAGAIVEFWNGDGSAKLIDTNSDGDVDLGTVASAGGVRNFTVKIFIPANTAAVALDGTIDYTMTVQAASSNNPSETDNTRDNIDGILAASADIAGDGLAGDVTNNQSDGNTDGTLDSDDITVTVTIDPGATATYNLQVVNTGANTDSFDISATGEPSGSITTFYTDPNCDGNIADGVEITNTSLIGGTAVRADDGSCTNDSSTLCVYDTANFTAGDSVIVALDGTKRTVNTVNPLTKVITLTAPMAGAATPGDLVSESICVVMKVVTIAATTANNYNIVTTITSPLSGATDNMDASMAVNQICSVSVSPDGSDQLPAGGTTTYNHTLSNNGNYTVNVAVTITGIADLTYVLLADTDLDLTTELYAPATGFTVTLAPGVTFAFQTSVQAPTSVAPGTVESITVNAIADGGTCSAVALDTTTVIEGYLQLIKSRDVATAAPGDVISYSVQYKNIGSKDAQKIVVSDNIPNYTTFKTDGFAAGNGLCLDITCDGTCDTQYSNGSGDDLAEYDAGNNLVRFRVGTGASSTEGGTVAPGELGCTIFKVTVD